jgi:alpha-mannosidase
MESDRATIHVVPHFHYDPVWIEDQRTYTRRAFDLVLEYLRACREDEGYRFMLSEIDYVKPFLGAYSDEREFVRELVEAGRVQVGGAYGQPNEMSIQGESIIRNIVYGRRYYEAALGGNSQVYMPLDVFGHCVQLPQIAVKAGFQAVVWSKDMAGARPLCYALAPNGKGLLQKHEHYWYGPGSFEEFLDTVCDGLEKQAALGVRQDLRLLGGDMAPPPAWLTGRSGELATRDPAILISTAQQYLEAVRPEAHFRAAAIPLVGRDFSWYHMGTAVSRAELKIANRLAENRLLSAEKWATLAALTGARYPELALDKAWRQLLFGQHHDAITGTSDDTPFLDLLAGYREALELAAEVEERALSYVTRRIGTRRGRGAPREGAALAVFNPLGWERTDVCRARIRLEGALASGFEVVDDRGRSVPSQVTDRGAAGEQGWVEVAFLASDVPSVGYRTYYVRPARGMPAAAAVREAAEAAIENESFSVRASAQAGGGLTSIYDKRADRELVNSEVGPANEVVALAERPDREMAPWELFTTGEMVRAGERSARVSVLEGPVFSQVQVRTELPGKCGVRQEVTLFRGLGRIELRTVLEGYRGEHDLFALVFPLAIKGVPTFEDRFAAVVRKRSCGRLDFRTLEEKNLSDCGLGSAQNWMEVGPAPSLWITERGRRVGAMPLGPCGLITSSELRERAALRGLEAALLRRGLTASPWVDGEDPEKDTAWCAFRISLGVRNAYSQKVLEGVPEAAGRLAEMIEEGEWGAVLVSRADREGRWPAVPVLVADTADPRGIPWLAEEIARRVARDGLELPKSCDFSGLAAPGDDYGVALVNRGSLAASVESDGTLAALLCHTAAWSTRAWGEGRLERFLIPEQKSHVFAHALVPHAGDWRKGAVVRAGYEVNNPLKAVQAPTSEEGGLPLKFSLVSVSAPNVVITTVKPAGYPTAANETAGRSPAKEGLIVRLYEAEGAGAAAEMSFGAEPEEAWLADLLEEKSGELSVVRPGWRRPPVVPVEVPACEIGTVGVRLAPLTEPGEAEELGPTSERCRPIHCRYWDHNAGAAPIGNQPVTLWLRGKLPVGETTRFSLGLSNDWRNQEITGRVDLLAPEEWQVIPRQVPYRIPAGSQAVYEIMVVVPPEAPPCFLRATTEDGDRVLQDVLPIGEVAPLEAALKREGDGFVLRVRNPNGDYVEGEVALITPLESWGPVVGDFALGRVSPRRHAFRLEAGEEKQLRFSVEGKTTGLWAVGKVMWYGQVLYVQESG